MKRHLLLACLLACVEFVHAQVAPSEPISVAAGRPLDGSARITAGTEQFLLFTVGDSLSQPQSILTRTIELDRQGTQDIVRVIQRYDGSGGTSIDTSTAIRSTLVPLTYTADVFGDTQQFSFGADSIVGTISSIEQGTRKVEVRLDTLVFNAVMLDEVIKALPLATERAFRFRTYNPGRDFGEQVVRVVESSPLSLADGSVMDTWVLSFEGGALPTTVWVSQGTQELIRLRTLLPNGAEFWKVRLYPSPSVEDGG